MASRSNTKFQKRQKEFARLEKRQDKAARKERRKAGKDTGGGGPPIEAMDPGDLGLPPMLEPAVVDEADETAETA